MQAGFSKFDHVVETKLAANPDLPIYAVRRGNWRRSNKNQKTVGDLINIAYYWLLQVEEYTTKEQTGKVKRKKREKKMRTRLFQNKDCMFFENDLGGNMIMVQPGVDDERILNAGGATMWLLNQKKM